MSSGIISYGLSFLGISISVIAISLSSVVLIGPARQYLHTYSQVPSINGLAVSRCIPGGIGESYSFTPGNVELVSLCPESGNPCSVNECNADGICEEVLADGTGYECFLDSQCSSTGLSVCSESCTCQSVIRMGCNSDSDCQDASPGDSCLETKCVSGTCVQNLTAGATCSDGTCGANMTCSNCQCEPIVVVTDSNWTDFTPTLSYVGLTGGDLYYSAYRLKQAGDLLEYQIKVNVRSSNTGIFKYVNVDGWNAQGITLNASENGAGTAFMISDITWASDNTICVGSGSCFVNTADSMSVFIGCYNPPGVSSVVQTYIATCLLDTA